MDAEPAEYQELAIRPYPARSLGETAEGRYWKRFGTPLNAQQIGVVTHLDFSPVKPQHLAATASTRVLIYDAGTRQLRRTIGRFKDKAYSGSWRRDGKLIVAGGESGIVQVFDVQTRMLLRQLKGHERPVHAARFSLDKLHVLSGGDDVTVRWWDLATGEQLARLDGHQDYVRCCAASPASYDTWATGAYDHVCRLWDVRQQRSLMELDHGAPIEDVMFFPSGAMVVTAGGTQVKVWDVLSGGRLLACLGNHQKTVTSIALSAHAGPASSAAPRLLTGSLDAHLKVYDLDTFQTTHATKYPAPIMSVALSPDNKLLAVGCSSGLLSVRKHPQKAVAAADVTGGGTETGGRRRYRPRLTASSYRYFLRGASERASKDDIRIAARRRAALAPYDRLLRKFRYRDALNAALATRQPEVVASVLEELAARAGLVPALGGRDAEGLLPLLAHVRRHISDQRHTRLLVQVAHRILDVYAGMAGYSAAVDRKLEQLRDAVRQELVLQASLQQLQGCLEPLLAAAAGASAAAEALGGGPVIEEAPAAA